MKDPKATIEACVRLLGVNAIVAALDRDPYFRATLEDVEKGDFSFCTYFPPKGSKKFFLVRPTIKQIAGQAAKAYIKKTFKVKEALVTVQL